MKIGGYAALYNSEGHADGLPERVAQGAFNTALRSNRDIVALFDHSPSALLGRTKSGTLRLRSDANGLRFSLDLPNTVHGNAVAELARRGDLGGMSFGFTREGTRSSETANGRVLEDVDLREVSIVSAFPAYPGTTVETQRAGGYDIAWSEPLKFADTKTERIKVARCYGVSFKT